jgi:hypothetical protein
MSALPPAADIIRPSGYVRLPYFTQSMPEVARCDTIEVGQPVLRTGSKIEARDQVEQALIGAIRDRDRQRLLVKSFDVAAD